MEFAITAAAGTAFLLCLTGCVSASSSPAAETGANILSHSVTGMDGGEVPPSTHSGKVLLIVNVASKCGFTPQYTALEALYRKYSDQGFVILAFPANDFLWQEPAANPEILSFCKTKYDVTFPVFAKIHVKGKEISPLYATLTSKELNAPFGGKIAWNFTKFLVDRHGTVINRFSPSTPPDAPEIVSAIQAALSETLP